MANFFSKYVDYCNCDRRYKRAIEGAKIHLLEKFDSLKFYIFLYTDRSTQESDKSNAFITIFGLTQCDLWKEESAMSWTCPAFVLIYSVNDGINVALICQPVFQTFSKNILLIACLFSRRFKTKYFTSNSQHFGPKT